VCNSDLCTSTGAVAIIAPILDMVYRSTDAGNFDDARLMGLGTGISFVVIGTIAFAAELRKKGGRAHSGAVVLSR